MFKAIKIKLAAECRRACEAVAIRRMLRREDGAAAVEFALVATPFLALVFAILETAIVFFAGQSLETAVADSARFIMTGQAQTQGMSQDQFKNQVCSRIKGLFDCTNGVYVDVRTYSSFGNATADPPVQYDANGKLVNNFAYQPGGPGDIVVVRLLYQWPIYVSFFGLNLADAGNKHTLVATAAFRNEPYQ